MSSAEDGDGSGVDRRALLAGLGAGLAGLVSACTVQPLHGSAPSASTVAGEGADALPPTGELSRVELQSPRNRVEQQFTNELSFRLTGGANAPKPAYALRFTLTKSESAISIERTIDTPAAYLLYLTVSFVLSDIETGRTLMMGSTFATASYDFSDQRFANQRAVINAEDRAAKVMANDVATRLAAYFASR
ncbi:LPS assembly lipoprotein LptE [Segnochrobactraceae bacterium EtOH-i3]